MRKLDEFAQGTGLDLSISGKAIAEAMGGKVGFESAHCTADRCFWGILPRKSIANFHGRREERRISRGEFARMIEVMDICRSENTPHS